MKAFKSIENASARPRAGKNHRLFSAVLLTLSLVVGSALSGGCVAVPAVMVTSATVTAAGLTSEGERFARNLEAGDSATVQNEPASRPSCGQTCELNGAPSDQEQPDV